MTPTTITFEVLHAQQGHSELKIDISTPEAAANSKSQIDDMLKMGYSIYVEEGEGDARTTNQVTGFDAEKKVYLIGGKGDKKELAPAEGQTPTVVPPPSGGCPVLIETESLAV